jgi:hypothetical protein
MQGFDVVFDKDVVDNGPGMIPWYATLAGHYSLQGFRMTWLGRTITHSMVRFGCPCVCVCVCVCSCRLLSSVCPANFVFASG